MMIHCFAGKDRTGFTVALVLETLGVDRDAILADFLRSNDAVPQLRESILESVRNRAAEEPTDEIVTFAHARLTEEVLGVREEYLDAAWRMMGSEYARRLSRGRRRAAGSSRSAAVQPARRGAARFPASPRVEVSRRRCGAVAV